METSQVAGTFPKSRGGTSRRRLEAARANRGLDGPRAGDVRLLWLNLGHVRLKTAPEAGREGAAHAGPWPNQRHRLRCCTA